MRSNLCPWAALALAALLAAPAAGATPSAATDGPPAVYVDRSACPFECCYYGTWAVLKAADLYDKPDGKRIGTLQPGEDAEALDGEMHVVPAEATVVYAYIDAQGHAYNVGETVYLLSYLGQGYQRVWYQGRLIRQYLGRLDERGALLDGCSPPSEDCWLRLAEDHGDQDVWWARLRTAAGKAAWAKVEDGVFGNVDSCP